MRIGDYDSSDRPSKKPPHIRLKKIFCEGVAASSSSGAELLLEDGTDLLLEDGTQLLLE